VATQQLGVSLRGEVDRLVSGLWLGAGEEVLEDVLITQGFDQYLGQAAVGAGGGQAASVQD
jgi:hypothetical protein